MPADRLAILVPDGTYPEVLGALLEKRRASLGIRQVPFEIVKDTLRDSSLDAAPLLRPFLRTCSHALVVRDLEGSGWEERGATALEEALAAELGANGWMPERVAVIVAAPEIEAWLRFGSSHMVRLVKLDARKSKEKLDLLSPTVIADVIEQTGGANPLGKPRKPKEAFAAILREFGIQRSNAVYGRLAEKESLQGCLVPSFQRLVRTLRDWFPAEG